MPLFPLRSPRLLAVMLLVGVGSTACQNLPNTVAETPQQPVEAVAPEAVIPPPVPAPEVKPKLKKVAPKPKPPAAEAVAAGGVVSAKPKAKPPETSPPVAGSDPAAAKPRSRLPTVSVLISRNPGVDPVVLSESEAARFSAEENASAIGRPATGAKPATPKPRSKPSTVKPKAVEIAGNIPPKPADGGAEKPPEKSAAKAPEAPPPVAITPSSSEKPGDAVAPRPAAKSEPIAAVAAANPVADKTNAAPDTSKPAPVPAPAVEPAKPAAVDVAATKPAEAEQKPKLAAAEAPPATTIPAAKTDPPPPIAAVEPAVTAPKPPPKPVAKAPVRRPQPPADPLATPAISESERLALAAIPLPKLPTLVSREPPAAAAAPAPIPAAIPAPPIAATPDDAQILLRRASERTGLGDVELARIAAAEQKLVNGEREAAIETLALLNADLDRSVRIYVVVSGENLRAIAARPENYGNAALWPLIWRANLEALPEPWAVQREQKLIVPSFPPLTDVAAALQYAQSHQQDVVRPEARAEAP